MKSEEGREYMMNFMTASVCPVCKGKRLRPESLAVKVGSLSIADFTALPLRRALEAGIADGDIRGLSLSQQTDANAVFGVLPNDAADRIRERVRFYDWDRAAGLVRWMCSWDTTESDVDGLVTAIREELAREAGEPPDAAMVAVTARHRSPLTARPSRCPLLGADSRRRVE